MKSLYESILDIEDTMDYADDMVRKIKKYGYAAVYNMSLSAQYIITELGKLYKAKWQKTSDKTKGGNLKFDVWKLTIPTKRYEEDKASYDELNQILLRARDLPDHVQLPEEEYYTWVEDYVDDEPGLIIQVLRIKFIDKRSSGKTTYIFGAQSKQDDPETFEFFVNGKYLKA